MELHHFSIYRPANTAKLEPEGFRLNAIVPGDYATALRRLHDDDPIWRSPNTYWHDRFIVDERRVHCRPRNRAVFWVTAAPDP